MILDSILFELKCKQCGGNLYRNNDMCSCPNCGTDYLITSLLQNSSNNLRSSNVRKNVEIEDDPTVISDEKFKNRHDLRTFNVTPGVRIIGNRAFYDCSSLESISFPSSLRIIGHGAFSGCHKLSHVDLPNNLEKIGINAFEKTAIKELYFSEDSANNLFRDIIDDYGVESIILPESWSVEEPEKFRSFARNVYIKKANELVCVGRKTGYFNNNVVRAVKATFNEKKYFKDLVSYISKTKVPGVILSKKKSLKKNTFWV